MKTTLFHLIALLLAGLLTACGRSGEPAHGDHEHEAAAPEPAKGPHGGRLLADGDFRIELTMYEAGVPPEFRVHATSGGKPVAPSDVQLDMALTRLGGSTTRIAFAPERDYSKSTQAIAEPHSFDVQLTARHGGKTHAWTFASHEGRTTIAEERAKSAGIVTAVAGPGTIRTTLELYGSIQPDKARVRNVVARFAGPIRSVARQLGDTVKAGETLATVESNESLQVYPIASPIDGVIVERRANPGEVAGTEPLFVVADFAKVWAELAVFPRDRARLATGQVVAVRAVDGGPHGSGSLVSISPAMTAGAQNLTARVALDNADGRWSPGAFVSGSVAVAETAAALVVPNSALQSFRDFTVVFAKVGETYEVRMLELGDSDGEATVVLGGLEPGTTIVTGNSYLIKADIEKSGASHDH